jgi:ADP-heptose:LPS heptosyltransferase
MHQLETYALISGAQIGECFIQEEEVEIPHGEYITFHPHHDKGDARQYDHWGEVVCLITDKLPDITMMQIGQANDRRYYDDLHCVDPSLLGKTTYNSLAYVIKHSVLHLGYDSLAVHFASHYQKKIVALFPHWARSSGPYFSRPQDVVLFEPDFSLVKPCMAYDDPYRLFNTIPSHDIANAVVHLLGN